MEEPSNEHHLSPAKEESQVDPQMPVFNDEVSEDQIIPDDVSDDEIIPNHDFNMEVDEDVEEVVDKTAELPNQ